MGVLVVVLLGALWASILVPGALRVRRQSSPLASVHDFERRMGMLANRMSNNRVGLRPSVPPGRHVMVLDDPVRVASGRPATVRAMRRRRTVLQVLAGLTALLAPVGLVARGGWLVLAVLSAAALACYVGLLLQIQAREQERRRKVRRMAAARPRPPQAAAGERVPAAAGAGRRAAGH